MKKLSLAALSAISLFLVSHGYAEAPKSGYYFTKGAVPSLSSAATALPATNITIFNSTNNSIYGSVDNTPILGISAWEVGHVIHNTWPGFTHLTLFDAYRHPFFDGQVCHYAVINVMGGGTPVKWFIDTSYC